MPPLRRKSARSATKRIRYLHYSIRTEDAYAYWARAFVISHGLQQPLTMTGAEVEALLSACFENGWARGIAHWTHCPGFSMLRAIGLQTNKYGHLQINAVNANRHAPSRACLCGSPFGGLCAALFGAGKWPGSSALFAKAPGRLKARLSSPLRRLPDAGRRHQTSRHGCVRSRAGRSAG